MIVNLITTVYNFLWGDLFTIPLPGGGSLGISLLILLLIPTGIYFTIRKSIKARTTGKIKRKMKKAAFLLFRH